MKQLKFIVGIFVVLCMVSPAHSAHKFVKKSKKIGVLNVVMEKVGPDTESNAKIQAEILKHAESLYTASLTEMNDWQVVSAAEVAAMEGLSTLTMIKGDPAIDKKLNQLANQDALPMENDEIMADLIKAAMSFNMKKVNALKGKALEATTDEMQQKVDAQVGRYYGLPGSPVVPRSVTVGLSSSKKESAVQWEIIAEEIQKKISAFCETNDLDGLALFTIRAEAGHVGDVFVINNNRTDGHIKANATAQLFHQKSKYNVDLGSPRMDDLAPFEMNVSIYNGSGVKATIPANIDLDAPSGEPLVEFKKIVDTTAKKLDKKLRKKLKLKK